MSFDFGQNFDLQRQQLSNQMEISEAQIEAQREISEASLENAYKIAQGGWAVQREGIKAQIKIAKLQLGFQKEQMERIGIPTMQAEIWYKQRQIELAEKAHSLAQANLGFEYLKFASTIGGPENYFQASDFARGATERQDVPVFLQNLLSNMQEGNAAFGAQGGTPDPKTAESLIAKLTGSTPTGDTQRKDAAALQAMGSLFQTGAHRISGLQNLDPNELALIGSAGTKLGYDVPQWLRQYQASRVGTENPELA